MLRLALVVLVCIGMINSSALGQWEQFGGPHRDFTSDEKKLLNKWPTDGPPELWRVERPGNYSGIAVSGDQLFVQFKETDGEDVVACLNTKDGETRWEYKYDVRQPPKEVYLDFGRGPHVTPLVFGDKVLTIGFMGEIRCLEKATGKLVWEHDILDDFQGKVHMFGYSISPILYDGLVIIGSGGRHGLIAMNQETGEVVWKSDPINVSYASPILIDVDGQKQLVLMASTELVAVDPSDGSMLWRFPHVNLNRNNCAQPLWGSDNRMFLSSHSDGGARAIELRQEKGITYVNQLWFKPNIKFFHSASQRIGDHVYGSSGTQSPTFLAAINLHSGEVVWRERKFDKAHILLADGKAILLDEKGRLSLARLTPEKFSLISQCDPLEKTAWAPPCLANGVLYLRDQHRILALDLRQSSVEKSSQ